MGNTIVVNITGQNDLGDALNEANQQLNKFAGKNSQITSNLNRNLANNFGALTNSFQKYRTNISGTFNPFVNGAFSAIRVLARLRTVFFLFAEALGIRKAIRIFEEIVKQSSAASNAIGDVKSSYDTTLSKIGDSIAPELKKIFEVFESFKLTLVSVAIDVLPTILDGVGYLITGMQKLVPAAKAYFEWLNKAADIEAKNIIPSRVENPVGETMEQQYRRVQEEIKADQEAMNILGKELARLDRASVSTPSEFDAQHAWRDEVQRRFDAWQKDMDFLLDNEFRLRKFIEDKGRLGPPEKVSPGKILNDPNDPAAKLHAAAAGLRQKNLQLGSILGDQGRSDGEKYAGEFIQGLKDGIATNAGGIREDAMKLGKGIRAGVTEGLSDTFLNVMQGKFNKFRDIIVNTLHSIQKAIANFLAEQAVKALIGGITSAVVSSGLGAAIQGSNFPGVNSPQTDIFKGSGYTTTPVKAAGGVVTRPTVGIWGEAGPERISPLGSAHFPRQANPRASGTGTVIFNINAVDGKSVGELFNKNKDQIKKAILEGANGGDIAIRKAFNLRR